MRDAGVKVVLAALAMALLSGCCSQVTSDPREGGLMGGVCGTATGAYDQRLVQREMYKDELVAANERLEARGDQVRREAGALGRDIAAKRRALVSIRSDLDRLQRMAGEKAALRAEITALKAEAGVREARIMEIETGIRSAADDRRRETARRQAEGVPIDDLLQRIEDIRAEAR